MALGNQVVKVQLSPRRGLAIALTFAFATAVATIPNAPAGATDAKLRLAASPSSDLDLSPTVDEPKDPEAEASALAVKTGKPVKIDERTDSMTEVVANPDGTFTASLSAEPVRAQTRGGSDWRPIDTNLRVVSDHLEPRVAEGDLRVSNGGAAGSTIASYVAAESDASYEVKSPWPLPTPTVDRGFATYVDVLPDVDLVVEAKAAGFSHNWVIRSAAAASDPRIQELELPIQLDGLTVAHEAGGLVYASAKGVEAWTPTPVMWDSSGNGEDSSSSAVDEGPSLGDRVAQVATTVSGDHLRLTPSAGLLESPQTAFPVVIDPTYVPLQRNRQSWTAVWSATPSKSYWVTPNKLGAGADSYSKYRSYFQFYTGTFVPKHVLSASLNVRQVFAKSCTEYVTRSYRTGQISKSTTWNNQPTVYGQQGSNSSARGCTGSTGMVSWDVTDGLQTTAAHADPISTFMVRSADEGNLNNVKLYDAGATDNAGDNPASLNVTYVSEPRVPAHLKIGAGGPSSSDETTVNWTDDCAGNDQANPIVLNSNNAWFRARPRGGDGKTVSNLTAVFRLTDLDAIDPATGSARVQDKLNRDGVMVADYGLVGRQWSYSANQATPPMTIVEGHRYKVNVRSRANWSLGGGNDGAFDSYHTEPCYFSVNSAAPSTPTLQNAAGEMLCNHPETGACVRGVIPQNATTFAFKIKDGASAPDKYATRYEVSVDGGPAQTKTASTTGLTDVTVDVTSESMTLRVWAISSGNIKSSPVTITVVSDTITSNSWRTDDPSGSASAANANGQSGASLTLGSGAALGVRGRLGDAIKLGTSPTVSSSSVVNTAKAYSLASWIRLDPGSQGTVLALPGANASALSVKYGSGRWSIAHARIDDPTAIVDTAVAGSTSPTGAWTHLTVVFNPACSGTGCDAYTLYVNGRIAAGLTPTSSAWAAPSGVLWLGCQPPSGTACASGRVDEVQLFDSALSASQPLSLANPQSDSAAHPLIAIGPNLVTASSQWRAAGTTASGPVDDQVGGASLTLTGGASVITTDDDVPVTAIRFPGSASQAATATGRLVVDSSGSFTAAVRVRIDDPSQAGVVMRGSGAGSDAWMLRYRPMPDQAGEPTVQWEFRRTTSATAPSSIISATKTTGANAGDFSTVAIVFDARSNQMRLHVNGSGQSASDGSDSPLTDFTGTVWAATERFVLGNGTPGTTPQPLIGAISEVIACDGAADADQIATIGNPDLTSPLTCVTSEENPS